MQIDVRNFQSIEHVSIKVDGFTALVGRSNIGKSAFVRAVKAALTGAGGTSFVRHGAACARVTKKAKTCECYASVHIQAEAFDLKWEKGDKRNRYTFNGQVYDRTETGTPDFLLAPNLVNDFDTVDVARKGRLLQVADQFDNVFLLDQTGSTVADVLSDVARLDQVNVAMRLIEKDRRESNSDRKVYEKEISELSAKVASYEGLDEVVGRVEETEKRLRQIAESQSGTEKLNGYLVGMGALESRIDELQKVSRLEAPNPQALIDRQRDLNLLSHFWAQVSDKGAVIRALSGVEDIPQPSVEPVRAQSALYTELSGWVDRLCVFQALFTKSKAAEAAEVPNPESLLAAHLKFLEVQAFVSKLEALKPKLEELTTQHGAVEAEYQQLVGELEALGVCPTCTTPLSQAHSHRDVA